VTSVAKIDWAARRREFERDGVTRLAGALDARWLARCEEAYDWSLEHPGPLAARLHRSLPGEFHQDLCNPQCLSVYDPLLRDSPVADIASALWDDPHVWFMYEQVFLKQGGDTRRTPWHQDAPYLSVDGPHSIVLWITFEVVPQEESLEFVRGSHRGPLYDGSRFDPADDTAPIYGTGELPRLPDIEADRSRWDIVSWPVEPGDVIAFHLATLHGGAPTREGHRRRTLSLRFFGSDAVYAARPRPAGPAVAGLHDALSPGDPFRHAAFPKWRPRA
jgi:ectoine hydroxylase-related dioxygenase (phytanoyl-CoA dioxygenase family)